jgi:hypothetical protein
MSNILLKCRKCGVNKKIGKFGCNKRFKNGKQIYCSECFKKIRKKYNNTDRAKLIDRKRVKLFREIHKEKVKEYNSKYYQKNKDFLKCKRNTESVGIVENTINRNSINRNSSKNKIKNPIVINPKPIEE